MLALLSGLQQAPASPSSLIPVSSVQNSVFLFFFPFKTQNKTLAHLNNWHSSFISERVWYSEDMSQINLSVMFTAPGKCVINYKPQTGVYFFYIFMSDFQPFLYFNILFLNRKAHTLMGHCNYFKTSTIFIMLLCSERDSLSLCTWIVLHLQSLTAQQ